MGDCLALVSISHFPASIHSVCFRDNVGGFLVPYILILAQKNKNLMKGTWVAGFLR